MVTHAKKAHPRKKADGEADEQAASAVDAADDMPETVSRSGRAKKEIALPEQLEEKSIASTLNSMGSEEPDFGLGIGDILHPDYGMKTGKVAPRALVGDADGSGKLSIESILKRNAQSEKSENENDEDDPVVHTRYDDPRRERHSVAKTVALVVLVLLFFAMAAAGVYMFVMKNDLAPFLGFGGSKQPSASNAAAPTAPQAPGSVNTVVIIGVKSPEGGTGAKPFLLSRAIETDVSGSDTFVSTGTGTAAANDRAAGTATIVNTTDKAYTFVVTTRLLSKDGVLFRMKKTTPIPANGSVDVEVAADQPGPDGDVGPTTFTIPGLSPELQALITAKSDAAMSGGDGKAKAVAASDLDGAKAALTEKLGKEADDNFTAMLTDGEQVNSELITAKELSVKAPAAGTDGATFSMALSLRFHALVIPEKQVEPLLDKALSDALPSGMSAADYSLGSPIYTVQAYDTAADTAEVRVEAPVVHR
jgi:hypothetical protein